MDVNISNYLGRYLGIYGSSFCLKPIHLIPYQSQIGNIGIKFITTMEPSWAESRRFPITRHPNMDSKQLEPPVLRSTRQKSLSWLKARFAIALSLFVVLAYSWIRNVLRPPPFDLITELLSIPSAGHIRDSSAVYTSSPHFVGQGLSQAEWTREKWREFGIPSVHIVSYDVEFPMPTEKQRVALVRGSEVLYEAPLNDSDGGFLPAFYSFSTNTNITASYVFANFGSKEDYDDLAKNNVSLLGSIAVIKSADASVYLQLLHLETSREVQIRNAQERGLAGVLMYPDPQNDGVVTESNGYAPYPEGPARPPEMIERGGIGPYGKYLVMFLYSTSSDHLLL